MMSEKDMVFLYQGEGLRLYISTLYFSAFQKKKSCNKDQFPLIFIWLKATISKKKLHEKTNPRNHFKTRRLLLLLSSLYKI